MNRSVAFLAAAALSLGAYTTAYGYSATADVTFSWATGGNSIGWTSNGVNTFPDPAIAGNDIEVATTPGNNSTAYYNATYAVTSDYAAGTGDDCLTTPANYDTIVLRKYACRVNDAEGYYTALYHPAPVEGVGPGASAEGELTVTDTTLTGTLTVITTTDEPTGGTTVLFQGVNIGTSSGDGADGYNIRTADGSPFGNAWYGITTSATLQVDLTGTFTATTWTIDGGAVTLSDAAFGCQQGGFGGDARGTLCTPSTVGGGFQPTGAHLSWGMDIDGATSGGTSVATPIEVRDNAGATLLTTLSGVLADLSLDAGGNITTNQGEFRFASGSAGGGCFDHVRWGGDTDPTAAESIGISCGTLSAAPLVITGVATGDGGPDTDPDPFTFTEQLDVALSTTVTSNTITVSGIDAPATLVLSGDASSTCSVNAGAFAAACAATVNNGDTVAVQHTSAATNDTDVATTLTIGSVPGTFTSTTIAGGPDTDPEPFTFTEQLDVALSTTVTSNTITVTGITAPATLVLSGDASSTCSVNGGAFAAACAATVNEGDTVAVQHTSAATNDTDVATTLTIGSVPGTFTSTTIAGGPDTDPEPFTFTPQPDVALSTTVTSNTITVTGITAPATLVLSGDASSTCSVNGGAFAAACAATVNEGDTVAVQHTSAATNDTDVATTLTIGSVPGTFTSTTIGGPDAIPDAFTFVDESDAALSTIVTSNTITVSGINEPATLALTGDASSTCSFNGGAFTADCAATVEDGDTVAVQHTSSDLFDTDVATTLTIGGIADTFTSTTESESTGQREDDGGSSLDALILALLGFSALIRRRR